MMHTLPTAYATPARTHVIRRAVKRGTPGNAEALR
jgi:hypothetical protein